MAGSQNRTRPSWWPVASSLPSALNSTVLSSACRLPGEVGRACRFCLPTSPRARGIGHRDELAVRRAIEVEVPDIAVRVGKEFPGGKVPARHAMVPTRRHQRLSAVGGEEPCHPVRVPAKCGEFLPARDVVAVDHSLSRPSENGLLVRRHRKRGDGGGLPPTSPAQSTSRAPFRSPLPRRELPAPDDGGHSDPLGSKPINSG